METAADICRRHSALSPAQVGVLEAGIKILQIVADIAHAQVTVYVRAKQDNSLVAVAQARPNTSFIQYKPSLPATVIRAAEEPLVWRTVVDGERVSGYREWAVGVLLAMRTFPLLDKAGTVAGAISFESSFDDTAEILAETAHMLFAADHSTVPGPVYRPLSSQDGIMLIDRDRIVYANAAAVSIYKILGVGRVVGRRADDRQINARLALKAAGTRQPQEAELEIGNLILIRRAIPIVRAGQTVRTVLIVTNVTEIRKKEKELLIKAAVIQEIHHRVKNNLQTIASLLRLQARRSHSSEVKAALRESVNRILSIAVVHEFLSQQDAEIIDVAEVAKNILGLLIDNMVEPGFAIQTQFTGERLDLPSDKAISLALVINELIQNAIEHGFVGRREGEIGVELIRRRDVCEIEIWDNGVGLPPDFSLQDSGSLGLQIIRTLIENDLGGKFRLFAQNGTRACISIPYSGEGG